MFSKSLFFKVIKKSVLCGEGLVLHKKMLSGSIFFFFNRVFPGLFPRVRKKRGIGLTDVSSYRTCSYTPASKKRVVICFSSVRPSATKIFRCTFLSNHVSQPLQTWYDASARGPTHRLSNSGPPVIYFLFPGSVHFWTLHLGIARVY